MADRRPFGSWVPAGSPDAPIPDAWAGMPTSDYPSDAFTRYQVGTPTRSRYWPVTPEDTMVPPGNAMGDVGSSYMRPVQQAATNAVTEPFSTRQRTPAEGWRDIGMGFGMGSMGLAPAIGAGIETGVGALGRALEGAGAETLGGATQAGAKYAAPALGNIGMLSDSALAAQQAADGDWRSKMPENLKEQPDETKKIAGFRAQINKVQNRMDDALWQIPKKDRAASPLASSYTKQIDGFTNQIDNINKDIHDRQQQWLDANEPFYDRFPLINAGAPFVGAVGGGLTGYATGAAGRSLQKTKAADWNQVLKDNADLFKQPGWENTEVGRQVAGELQEYQKRWPYISKSARIAGSGLVGAAEGIAGSAFPTVYDQEFLPPGSPNQIEASKHWGDPWYWARLGGAAAMGGITAPIGAYTAMKKRVIAPEERTAGLFAPPVADFRGGNALSSSNSGTRGMSETQIPAAASPPQIAPTAPTQSLPTPFDVPAVARGPAPPQLPPQPQAPLALPPPAAPTRPPFPWSTPHLEEVPPWQTPQLSERAVRGPSGKWRRGEATSKPNKFAPLPQIPGDQITLDQLQRLLSEP